MNHRKPRIKKEDAAMIAIRVAVADGADVGLAAEVTDPFGDDWWSVFVPDRIPGADPGGVIVRVHKQTGESEMQMSL
jgi:hypothetical protein